MSASDESGGSPGRCGRFIGVGWRAPYFHDGRAPVLVDRFNPKLAGSGHGFTSDLTTPEIDDLVHFLQTL
jgi:hypothetical protein